MPDRIFGTFCDGLKAKGRWRRLRTVSPEAAGRVRVDGRTLLNFSSNDYLGLSRHPEVIRRAREWMERWGAGSCASRLVCGNLEPFGAVEEKIARGKRTQDALVFTSGYHANTAILPALLDPGVLGGAPVVFSDRLNHASIHAGCRAAGVRQIRYRHKDMEHLEDLLKSRASGSAPRFILSETVFSMDGDRADVGALVELAARFGAFLYLDEAHATGVLGADGFGLSADHPDGAHLVMGTFGKALGGFGAYAACSTRVRDYLVNRCAGFIYTTALPPAVLGAIDAALDLIPSMAAARERLLGAADRVRAAFRRAGLDCGSSTTQIVPVFLGEDAQALDFARDLEEAGMLAVAIRPPSVPEGTSRIRFALSAAHNDEDVALLCEVVPRLAAARPMRRAASGDSPS